MPVIIRRALTGAMLACVSVAAVAVDFGRTAGSFAVSATGSANYTIPIWTPPGTNGVQPSISLVYDSNAGNGLGGMGWNLAAASYIERCARTVGQDGGDAGVELTTSDPFCIGGSRLRLIGGTYGASGSIYYTEISDYSRITASGTAGNGPNSFLVEGKSGLKYEYGGVASARVFPGISPTISTTVQRWMLNKVYDRNGNNYVISYNNVNGFAVPDVISWTPTSLGAGTYRYEAKFNYTNSRTDADSIIGKLAGFDVANRYRLESIQIKSAGAVVRKYRFSYDTSPATSRSRLTSAKDCADDGEANCLLPLTFDYQAGVSGFTPGAGSPPAGSSDSIVRGRYDLNGDGKDDIAFKSGANWQVAFSTNTGFSTPYSTGISTTVSNLLIDRFLPNGRDAILVPGTPMTIVGWDDATLAFVSTNTGINETNSPVAADYDGDNLADLVHVASNQACLVVRRNTGSSASAAPSFSATTFTTACFLSNARWVSVATRLDSGIQRSDFNGDGRQDLYGAIQVQVGPFPPAWQDRSTIALGNSSGFVGTADLPSTSLGGINFNGDSCTDAWTGSVTAGFNILVSKCAGANAIAISAPASPLIMFDWNGDGKTDILVNNGGNFGVYLSTGNGFSSIIPTSVVASGSFFTLDLDGDKQDDLIKINGTSAVSYWTHTSSGQVPAGSATNVSDLLSSVSDGFGVVHTPNYVSTAWSNYDKGAATVFPLQESDPRVVVAKVTSSNGIGGTYDQTYFYSGARTNAQRDEFVGFQRMDVTDSRNGLITRTYREQSFPVAGMVSQTELMQPNGTTAISREVFTNSFAMLDTTANNQRYFVYPSASTATQYEVGGTWNGNLLRTVVTANIYDNASGALYDQTTITSEPGSGAHGLTNGGSWLEHTYTPLANLFTDTVNWCIGRPGQVKREKSHNLVYGDNFTFTTNINWNGPLCRPTQTLDEPGSATLQVTTDLGYDSFGNVSATTVTGIGMTPRTTSTAYSDATFTTGQFPLSVTNALGQISTSAWNYDLGVPTSATDPNGLSMSWLYDSFGRRAKQTRTDGTATTFVYNNCTAVAGGCVGAGNKAVVIETARTSLDGFINDVWRYLDAFDRPIVSKTRTLTGVYNRIDQEYDALGRLYRQSAPCLWTSCTTYWTTNTYDLISRPTATSRPVSETDPTLQTTTLSYEGLTTRLVDAQGKQSLRVLNSAGEVYQITDHDGYFQAFEYYSFGGVARVMATSSSVLQTSNYNARGMLTRRTDMDMGTWTFTPNALGETVSQTDAKGQNTTFAFDLLGRLTSRTEAEGTSTWTWGTSASAKNIGQLASLSGPGYSETYTYNTIAKVNARTITADSTNYLYNFGYNTQGLVDNLTYPTSTAGYRLKLKFDYQNGELYRIRDFNALTTVFWTATAANSRDQITQETLGNGLVSNRAFDAVSGWLKSIQTGLSGGTGVQNLAYTWDKAGNLASRKDVNQSNLTETFFYDNLYRLDYSQLNGVTNLDLAYDATGNITNKSDVGSYTYHATKKHQVSSTSNGWSFVYDNNGNMTSGRGGSAITWKSYNYPDSITNGANTASFSYTSARQYYKQVSNYASGGTATTIYVGGLLEKVTTSTGTDYRHMIRAGNSTVIVSRQSGGTNTTNYVMSDHLGSSSAITNSTGAVLVSSSFGAFGQRRGSNWSGGPSAADWSTIASTTRRGYTDHTMLDNLALIHMNGRAQDSILGRFLSADPFITDPRNTQNYNRYSYVYNRPLTSTDPSGFCEEGEEEVTQLDGDTAVVCRAVVTVTGTPPKDLPLGSIDFTPNIFGDVFDLDFLNPVFTGGVASSDAKPGKSPQGERAATALPGRSNRGWCKAMRIFDGALLNLGPVKKDTPVEDFLWKNWLDAGGPVHLSDEYLHVAQRQFTNYPSVLVEGYRENPITIEFNGTRLLRFGMFEDSPLDFGLGSATGYFRNGQLVGVRDHFDMNPREQHNAFANFYINTGLRIINYDAEMFCGLVPGFDVTMGDVGQ